MALGNNIATPRASKNSGDRRKEVKKEDQPSLFAKKLTDVKELKRKHQILEEERTEREMKVFNLETSVINDFKEFQEASLEAGLIKNEELTVAFGRFLSDCSSSTMESLKNLPEMKSGAVDWEEMEKENKMKTPKSSRKSAVKSQSRKRKR